ncbi:TPA: hypothetical protein ACRRUM_005437 [Escherichia coli]
MSTSAGNVNLRYNPCLEIRGQEHLAAEALMKLVASNNPPLRLILGSMVYDLAMDTLKARMATWEEWEAVSRASEKAIPAPERYGV